MVWAKRIGGVLVALGAILGLFMGWVWIKTSSMLSKHWDIDPVRIEHPWPFGDADLAQLRAQYARPPEPTAEGEPAAPTDPLAGLDLESVRRQRAVKRGEALAIRLGCLECHGEDLGGNVVMDVAPVMGIIAPNLTLGNGGLPGEYSLDDFDRIVRHGVKRDGTTALMPAVDYEFLSNKEVSDLFAFILTKPHVDRQMPPSYWGPVMRVMVALGRVPPPAAFRIDHDRSKRQEPPPEKVSVELGAHLAKTCVGCHRADYSGGPIGDGDPAWPPAANLTPHEEGLKGWTKNDFFTLMRSGERPDGSKVDPHAMPWQTVGYLTDVQTESVWLYLESLPPKPTGR
ncbi:MAG: c-type cytochrome [Alphaproteobacteria bacterium]|nr:c-type cytochrome [Alphaproteobacteria bacterium]